MKTITIGDIHGKRDWEILKTQKKYWDKIIFVGDYVDSYDHSNREILENLKEIILFKMENPNKVVLLLGNHDVQYFSDGERFRCSGYRVDMFTALNQIFETNKDIFQLAYQYKNWVWTHAGISKDWVARNIDSLSFFLKDGESLSDNMAESINKNWDSKSRANVFMQCGRIRGGSQKTGSSMWCDRSELIRDPYEGLVQVVGHSRMDEIQSFGFYEVESRKARLIFTDVLDSVPAMFFKQYFVE